MDVERTLLGKALQTGQLDDLIARGIEPEHFSSHECQEVYNACLDHVRKYQEPPSIDVVRDTYPDFSIQLSQDGLDYITDRFIKQVKRREAIKLGEIYSAAIDDPNQVGNIEELAMEMAATLMEIVPQPRVGRYSDVDERIEEYERKKDEDDIWGLKCGLPTIDEATLGLQSHELAVIVAWQGTGKSTFMQMWAWNMYLQGKVPLFISLEMEREALLRKWDSMAENWEYHSIKAGHLSSEQIKRWREIAQKAKEFRAERDIIVIDDLFSCTPDRVLAETRRYKPDAVFVDYIELMDSPRRNDQSWQEINMIGKELKRNARFLNIPVIAAAQTNSGDGGNGPTLGNISYKSTGKHADQIIGLHRDEDMERDKVMEVRLLKNRDGKPVTVEAHWDPEINDYREKRFSDYAKERMR